MSATFYDRLGLPSSATNEQIKKAYRNLALKWHPDKNIDNRKECLERFQNLTVAYNVLSRKQTREDYDFQLLKEKVKEYNQANDFIDWALKQCARMQEHIPKPPKPKNHTDSEKIYKRIKKFLSQNNL